MIWHYFQPLQYISKIHVYILYYLLNLYIILSVVPFVFSHKLTFSSYRLYNHFSGLRCHDRITTFFQGISSSSPGGYKSWSLTRHRRPWSQRSESKLTETSLAPSTRHAGSRHSLISHASETVPRDARDTTARMAKIHALKTAINPPKKENGKLF